jgi:hypothetical protein
MLSYSSDYLAMLVHLLELYSIERREKRTMAYEAVTVSSETNVSFLTTVTFL